MFILCPAFQKERIEFEIEIYGFVYVRKHGLVPHEKAIHIWGLWEFTLRRFLAVWFIPESCLELRLKLYGTSPPYSYNMSVVNSHKT